ncbi:hypothetical protein Goarm_013655 [Gossypium armourianum]|uniref:Uncharacterized protein n=1 Tax=Gossypium armourianum TaxID=34283 RepID=A0A7J9J3N7_9ROSI|nr:hypothetical protein [Gossypium armourianum]
MVPTACLTSHLTVNVRACCELSHALICWSLDAAVVIGYMRKEMGLKT